MGDRISEALRALGIRESDVPAHVLEGLREAVAQSPDAGLSPFERESAERFRRLGLSEGAARVAARGREDRWPYLPSARVSESAEPRQYVTFRGRRMTREEFIAGAGEEQDPTQARVRQLMAEGMAPGQAALQAVRERRSGKLKLTEQRRHGGTA